MVQLPVALLIHMCVSSLMIYRILHRRLAVNTTLAWLIIVSALPIAGVVFYFLFGDHRLGRKRLRLGPRIRDYYQNAYDVAERHLTQSQMDVSAFFRDLSSVVSNEIGFYPSMGNKIRLFDEAGHTLAALVDDIDAANISCFLEFYIIQVEGRVIEVMNAIERAAMRGVDCRILADDIGSREFLNGEWSKRLAAAGVHIERSLGVGLIKSFSTRTDLRNHRKLIIIDQSIGYIGSYNLVDPVQFKTQAGVGQWIDIMARLEGHIVSSLAVVFNTDFIFDAGEGEYNKENLHQFPSETFSEEFARDAVLQLIPSGPEMRTSLIYEVIIASLFGARRSITIITPYFVPNETIVMALCNAAKRGIAVKLILPERLDSIMARHASEAVFDKLLESGVMIKRYQNGMLHTKAILIDETVSFIGTVNMDMRSFYLNLEVTLAVYDARFTRRLQRTVQSYEAHADALCAEEWGSRSSLKKFKENIFRLAAPLL